MDVSVIIAARNEERHLAQQLDALLRQDFTGDWEIIVADNGSTDGTAALIAEYATRSSLVRCLDASKRADKSYALNLASGLSDAPLLAFTDADDVVTDNWLSGIVRGLQTNEVVTGPDELDRLNPEWLASSRGRGDEAAVGSFAGVFPTIRGNNFGVRTTTWNGLGGMSENMYPCDDLEFSFRCWRAGIPVVGLPDAVVHYRYREAPRVLWRQGWHYGTSRPRIARMVKDAGEPLPARFAGWRSWLKLLVLVPTLVTRVGRARCLWILGNRIGQVFGSVRHRVLML